MLNDKDRAALSVALGDDKLTPRRRWHGDVPSVDNFDVAISTRFVDGATKYGPWAIMSPRSHKVHGRGLGTGKGQLYEQNIDGYWYKIDG